MDGNKLDLPISDATLDAIRAHAAQRGESVQAFILRAIRDTMYNDTHPRMMDSDREIRQRIIDQYNA